MRAACHLPVPKEQIHLYRSYQLPSRPGNKAGLPCWLGKPRGTAAGWRALSHRFHFRSLVGGARSGAVKPSLLLPVDPLWPQTETRHRHLLALRGSCVLAEQRR